jgi:integrase
MSLLRSMFNQAAVWKMFSTNPSDNPAGKLTFFREEERERFLSEEEHHRVSNALAKETSPYWRNYFPLCLMLGTRRSELLAARCVDIDWSQRTLRIPTTKAGKPHLLPLPAPAVDILKSLPSLGNSDFVFPGEGASGHLVEVKAAWDRIRKRAGMPDVRVHDLRRTLGSWLTAQGYSLTLVGKALGHRNLRSTQIYARLALGPMREALERNAALMMGTNGADSDAGAQ